MSKPIKIIISGGGTGGHIFPAIAIAKAFERKFDNPEILFIGAEGKMEMEKVPAAGYKIEALWISGLQRSLSLKNLSFPFKIIASLYKAGKIIKSFQPDLVVGVGGFASGPTLYKAAQLGIPTLIQEQNSFPGITNKLLAKKVDKICVAYPGMEKFFPAEKISITGNPVRAEVIKIEGLKNQAAAFFELENNKKTILVVGGSLGARTINEAIEEILMDLKEKDIQLIWQTGINYGPKALEAVKKINCVGIKTMTFIQRMDLAYAAADLVISRAGAIAISELCAVKKAVILVPSPFVAEDHQTKNALALVGANAAVLVKDVDLKLKLKESIFELINDETKKEELSKNIAKLAHIDAADTIVNIASTLIKK